MSLRKVHALGAVAVRLFVSGPLISAPHPAGCWPWRPCCQGCGLIAAPCPAQHRCSGDNWRKPRPSENPEISSGGDNCRESWQGTTLHTGTAMVPTSCALPCPRGSPLPGAPRSPRSSHTQARTQEDGAVAVRTGTSLARVPGHRHERRLRPGPRASGTTSTPTHECGEGGAAARVCGHGCPAANAAQRVCSCADTQPRRSRHALCLQCSVEGSW